MFLKMTLCALLCVMGTTQESGKDAAPQAAPATTQTTEPKAKQEEQQPVVQTGLEEREINGVRLAAIEANIVSYTNQERARYGLPALEVDDNLMSSAREHAAWMTRFRSMVHTKRPVAENIAMGQPHSSDVVRAWMNSAGHRANILNAGHHRIGVAAFRTDSGTIFWCQQFRP
jgi:uncharacterized protein YkwD